MSVQALLVEACWRPMVGDVAGDFHDVIDLNDGRVAIALGDVAGVGVDSAEQADELRAMVHRIFRRSDDPSVVLERLDDGAERFAANFYATMACAVIDPATRSVSIASAGHPPILFSNGVDTRFLEGAVGPPLGIMGPRPTVTYPLPGDAALFLYTDGLVERRGSSLDETLDQLLRAGRGLHGAIASAAELARRATSRLGQPDDDATVMSVRLLTNGTRRAAEGDLIGVRPRIVLRVYLDPRDLRSTRTESVLNELALRTRATLDFLMEIVDIGEPGVDTESDGVLAAPTLVRISPPPVIRVVGTVDSVEDLARALQLPLTPQEA